MYMFWVEGAKDEPRYLRAEASRDETSPQEPKLPSNDGCGKLIWNVWPEDEKANLPARLCNLEYV